MENIFDNFIPFFVFLHLMDNNIIKWILGTIIKFHPKLVKYFIPLGKHFIPIY